MNLEFRTIDIKGIEWGEKTTVSNGVLYINKNEALEACGQYDNIEGLSLHIARPGESIRILPVKSVTEPRCKATEEGSMCPGIGGPLKSAGIGATLALTGAAVLVTENNDAAAKCRTGGLVDMSGPAAEYCPFSKTFNVVINVRVKEDVMAKETLSTDEVCRHAGFNLAVYLADCCKDLPFDSSETYSIDKKYPELPGVVYVMELLAQNPEIIDFHVYGQLAGRTFIPTVMDPAEIMDGAVTTFLGSHCTVCTDKQYMYEVQNSPVIEHFYKQHGKTVNFLGVIVHNEVTTLEGKQRANAIATNLAKLLGARGAIFSTEGHGNPDEDIMMNVKSFEDAGISTVIISDEMGGRDGRSPGVADWVKECDAMVSVGNMHQLLAVPKAMKEFIGNEPSMEIIRAAIDHQPEDTTLFYTEMIHIPCACAQAGLAKLSARWI